MAPKTDIKRPTSSSLNDLDSGPVRANGFDQWPALGARHIGGESELKYPKTYNFTNYDLLTFVSAHLDESFALEWDDGLEDSLTKLVKSAHDSGAPTKVVLLVGNRLGSDRFSKAVATVESRKTLIDTLKGAIDKYEVDGVEIAWEEPKDIGQGNSPSPEDTDNLLKFFQEFRDEHGPIPVLAATVGYEPWAGPDGNPLTDVEAFTSVLDYITITAFGASPPGPEPGAYAPLDDMCHNSTTPKRTLRGGLETWIAAKFPSYQIVVDFAFHGAVSNTFLTLPVGGSPTQPPSDDFAKAESKLGNVQTSSDKVGATDVDLSSFWGGTIGLVELVDYNVLIADSKLNYGGDGGYSRKWDFCSWTPYLFSAKEETLVSYEDAGSLKWKAELAWEEFGVLGISFYASWQDNSTTLADTVMRVVGRI